MFSHESLECRGRLQPQLAITACCHVIVLPAGKTNSFQMIAGLPCFREVPACELQSSMFFKIFLVFAK